MKHKATAASMIAIALLMCGGAAVALFAENKTNNSPAGADPAPAAPVPLLTPEQEMKTFKLPPGFHAEVVAQDPMIEHPVALSFDPDGRIWVVEMRAYMPNIEGKGEEAPKGRVSILEDTDGDGKMDKATVFLDNLVMPRAIGLTHGGALVATPPNLIFYRDTDGDGKADKSEVVATDYGNRGNVEHQPNGLTTMLDNWIYNADYGKRIKNEWDKWVLDPTPDMGQWGITQDNAGRLFFNTNSDQLRGNLYAPHYALRNPHYAPAGINIAMAADQNVWPAHGTAVNRGYLPNFLRDGGKLARFTAACAPLIYRGGIFPAEFDGNAFVCEPSANVIRRNVITTESRSGKLAATNPYDKDEFLASTYERFRPVSLYNGPDGALYVVDMHHGLLQHTTYLTRYAAKDYLQRELDKHLQTGRIFRIVPDGAKLFDRPKLSKTLPKDLVPLLAHPNGWWRDTAQRLLVEKNPMTVVPALQAMVKTNPSELGRLHALWTLEGMRRLDPDTIAAALKDKDPTVRAAAVRVSEFFLRSPRQSEMLPAVLKLANDPSFDVKLQFALSVGEIGTPESDAALVGLLGSSDNLYIRDAAISGLAGRELEFLSLCLDHVAFSSASQAHSSTIAALSSCVLAEAQPKRVAKLMDLVAAQQSNQQWRQLAMLEGVVPSQNSGRRRAGRRGDVVLPTEPAAVIALQKNAPPDVREKLTAALDIIHWPGQPGYTPPPPPPPLSAAEQQRFEAGRVVYTATCAQCHKPTGMGQPGLAPPLLDSDWALGPPEQPIRIALHGVRGPINVNGQTFNMEMPALKLLNDEQIAAVLTYVRREWQHGSSPITPQQVAAVRAQSPGRQDSWTQAELLNVARVPDRTNRPRDARGPTTQTAAPDTPEGD
jgi:putative membrane-bound dehydrogenase-like protein